MSLIKDCITCAFYGSGFCAYSEEPVKKTSSCEEHKHYLKNDSQKLPKDRVLDNLNDMFYEKDVEFLGNDEANPFSGYIVDLKFCSSDGKLLIAIRDAEDDVFDAELKEIELTNFTELEQEILQECRNGVE